MNRIILLSICAATSAPESPTLVDLAVRRAIPFLAEYAKAASKRGSAQTVSEATDEALLAAKSAGSAVRLARKELEAAVSRIESELCELGLKEEDAKSVILAAAVSEADQNTLTDILYPYLCLCF